MVEVQVVGRMFYQMGAGCKSVSHPLDIFFYKSETEQQYVHKVGHRSQHVTTQCHSNKNLLGTYPLASIPLAL